MGMLVTYVIVCGAAWYAGGPRLALMAFCVVSLLWALSAIGNRHSQDETTEADRERHRHDGKGHIYYVRDDKTIHECDGCAGCMQNRANELRRQGYHVEHIPGRRNSGDLV